jgi:hypothetical protein
MRTPLGPRNFDPIFAYIQPDEGKRKRVVGAQIRLMVNIGLRCGVSDATPDAKGVVVGCLVDSAAGHRSRGRG